MYVGELALVYSHVQDIGKRLHKTIEIVLSGVYNKKRIVDKLEPREILENVWRTSWRTKTNKATARRDKDKPVSQTK